MKEEDSNEQLSTEIKGEVSSLQHLVMSWVSHETMVSDTTHSDESDESNGVIDRSQD